MPPSGAGPCTLAGTYPESVTISKNVHLIGADMGALSLGSLVGPLSIIQAPLTCRMQASRDPPS